MINPGVVYPSVLESLLRRFIALAISGVLVLGMVSVAPLAEADPSYVAPTEPTFSDVGVDHQFFRDIEWMSEKGIAQGIGGGAFGPTGTVSRGAFASWLYELARYTKDPAAETFTPPGTPSFSDVGTGHVFFEAIEWMKAAGVTSGHPDGTFGPSTNIKRQEVAAFFYRYAGEPSFPVPTTATFSDVGTGHQFFEPIEWLARRSIAKGTPGGGGVQFLPTTTIARQETAALFFTYEEYFATRRKAAECEERYDPPKASRSGHNPQGVVYGDGFEEGWNIVLEGASWLRSNGIAQLKLHPLAGPDVCVLGGAFAKTHDHDTTTWHTWHSVHTTVIDAPGTELVETTLWNVGDGFRFPTMADEPFSLQGVKVTDAHDDCVENDGFSNGFIDDSFFAGCYVFYSARDGKQSLKDGSGHKVAITNSLIHLKVMPFDDAGNEGHGPIWKMGNGLYSGGANRTGISPDLELRNLIIRVDRRPTQGGLSIPRYDADPDQDGPIDTPYIDEDNCDNVTIVLVDGATLTSNELASWPDGCLETTTDISVWEDAVDEWEAAHQPYASEDPRD